MDLIPALERTLQGKVKPRMYMSMSMSKQASRANREIQPANDNQS